MMSKSVAAVWNRPRTVTFSEDCSIFYLGLLGIIDHNIT